MILFPGSGNVSFARVGFIYLTKFSQQMLNSHILSATVAGIGFTLSSVTQQGIKGLPFWGNPESVLSLLLIIVNMTILKRLHNAHLYHMAR